MTAERQKSGVMQTGVRPSSKGEVWLPGTCRVRAAGMKMARNQHLWGIVLAAGSGERLQPFLRRCGHQHPIKQFCAVTGRRTILQHTWDRLELLVP